MVMATNWISQSEMGLLSRSSKLGIADLRLYSAKFQIWGNGSPIVLVPGLAGGLELIEPLAYSLSRWFQVISFESRGEDDCFALRRSFNLDDLSTDLIEFIDWMGLERPAVFGVSFGGAVALRAAIRQPGKFGPVVALGVGARFERGLLQRIASLVLSTYPLPADNPFINQFLNLLFGTRTPRRLVDQTATICWRTDQAVIAHRLRMLRKIDLRQGADTANLSPLLLCGGRDIVVSPKNTRALAQVMPSAVVHELSDCGHLACVSHPSLLAEVVRQHVFA